MICKRALIRIGMVIMKNISTNSDVIFYKLYHTAFFFLTEKKSASRASFIVVKKKKKHQQEQVQWRDVLLCFTDWELSGSDKYGRAEQLAPHGREVER